MQLEVVLMVQGWPREPRDGRRIALVEGGQSIHTEGKVDGREHQHCCGACLAGVRLRSRTLGSFVIQQASWPSGCLKFCSHVIEL